MTGRGFSSVQRSGQAERATDSRAALNRSIASRPFAVDGVAGLLELLASVIGRRAVRGKAGAGRPQAASASALPTGVGQREGGVRGEHRGETACAPPGRGIPPSGPGCRSDRAAAGAGRGAAATASFACGIDAADIGGDAAGAVGEGGVAQVADQRRRSAASVERRPGIHAPGDGQRHQQHRIAERVFVSAGAEARGEFQEILGECRRPGRWGYRSACWRCCDVLCGAARPLAVRGRRSEEESKQEDSCVATPPANSSRKGSGVPYLCPPLHRRRGLLSLPTSAPPQGIASPLPQ